MNPFLVTTQPLDPRAEPNPCLRLHGVPKSWPKCRTSGGRNKSASGGSVCRFLYTPGGSQLVNIPAAKVIISSNAIEIAICGLDRSITVTFKPTPLGGWRASGEIKCAFAGTYVNLLPGKQGL